VIVEVGLVSLAVKPCWEVAEVDCQALLSYFWDFDTNREPEKDENY
jgi:hypothetical protein